MKKEKPEQCIFYKKKKCTQDKSYCDYCAYRDIKIDYTKIK